MNKTHLLVTNDDGIEADGLIALVTRLHNEGHPIVVLAPQEEQSATGMKLTLSSGMKFTERTDIADSIANDNGPPLRMFSLDGSPCDCVIVALEGGLKSWAPEIDPMLCISGINHGPNLSVDVLHSGTVSAAREASLYGMPAIATSLATYSHRRFDDSLSVIVDLIEKGALGPSPTPFRICLGPMVLKTLQMAKKLVTYYSLHSTMGIFSSM